MMRLDQDLASFMSSPVMIILGTCNDALQPDIGRAVGALVNPAKGEVDLVVSAWQWPQTVSNVQENGRFSVTFARPSDYVSFQAKGHASVIAASAEHLARSAAYIGAITAVLTELGLEREISKPWFVDRDTVALRLVVESVFVQTPGAAAGEMVRSGQ